MEFRTFLLLYCLHKFNGERSVSGVYHLLTGKKSAQTIQDAKLFDLSFLFQTLKPLKREQLHRDVDYLKENNLIQLNTEERYCLTSMGEKELNDAAQFYTFPAFLNGWRYGDSSRKFWSRYVLLTQTVSNLLIEKNDFFPIITDPKVLNWTKGFLQQTRVNRRELADTIYKETFYILNELPDGLADLFILRVSSHERTGSTIEQTARHLKQDVGYTYLLFQSVLHFFVRSIASDPKRFSTLQTLALDDHRGPPLTTSTQETFHFLQQGKKIDEIALIRSLKESTIEDHIVELALYLPSFNIDPFVPDPLQKEITAIANHVGTKRLKIIREALDARASYFQIRLMLAKGEK